MSVELACAQSAPPSATLLRPQRNQGSCFSLRSYGARRAVSNVHTLVEVHTLAGSRGYTLFNLGADHYWLVEKATKVPELNVADDTLHFSLNQAWTFLHGEQA